MPPTVDEINNKHNQLVGMKQDHIIHFNRALIDMFNLTIGIFISIALIHKVRKIT